MRKLLLALSVVIVAGAAPAHARVVYRERIVPMNRVADFSGEVALSGLGAPSIDPRYFARIGSGALVSFAWERFADIVTGEWQQVAEDEFTLSFSSTVGTTVCSVTSAEPTCASSGLAGPVSLALAPRAVDIVQTRYPGFDFCDPFSGFGVCSRSSQDLEMGFNATVAADRPVTLTIADTVPEPATWALLIIGFGLTGAAMRRQTQLPRRPARAMVAA